MCPFTRVIGRPLRDHGAAGDAVDHVRQAEAGLTCEPENPGSPAVAKDILLQVTPLERERLGERGWRFYAEQLRLGTGVGRFQAALASCV